MKLTYCTVGIALGLFVASLAACTNPNRRESSTTGEGAGEGVGETTQAARAASAAQARPVQAASGENETGAKSRGISPKTGDDGHVHRDPEPAAQGTMVGRPALTDSVSLGRPAWDCTEDRVFRPSSSLVFSEPTAAPLAAALNELTKNARPISLVLRHKDGEFLAALSATRPGRPGREGLLPGKVPAFAPLIPAFGDQPAVTSEGPLEKSFLSLTDAKGTTLLELRHVMWRATRGASCEEMEIEAHAVIASSQYGTTLHLAGGDRAIADLAGVTIPPGGLAEADRPVSGDEEDRAQAREPIHFTFKGAATALESSL